MARLDSLVAVVLDAMRDQPLDKPYRLTRFRIPLERTSADMTLPVRPELWERIASVPDGAEVVFDEAELYAVAEMLKSRDAFTLGKVVAMQFDWRFGLNRRDRS